jgi:hypothetical protein
MAERQRDRHVGPEVQRVPRAVADPPTHEHERRRHRDGEQPERDRRQQDAGVARQQVAELAEEPDVVGERVAGGDEHRVRDDQRQAGRAVAPVPRRDAIEADRVEDRKARQQQQLDQRQERAEQAGHAP